jgi:integrase
MAKALTDRAIANMKPGPARREIPDGLVPGLYLVSQPSGAMSWAVRYRFGSATRKLTIGKVAAIPLKEARRLAQEALVAVARGEDPAAAKQAQRAAPAPVIRDRLEDVVDAYVEREAKKKTREASWQEVKRILEGEVLAAWAGRRLSEITRADVHELLDAIADGTRKWRRGAGPAPVLANRTLAAFRRVCNWSCERGIIDVSPCEKIRAPAAEQSRDRVLVDDEIKLVWQAADALAWPFGHAVKLLLLTGGRRDEICEARWSEIDLAARTWTLPASRSKNGQAHVIPLSSAALQILEALPRFEGCDLLFTTNGKTSISGWSRAKRQIDREIAALRGAEAEPIAHWQLHDLRRTAASKMAELGIGPHVIEAALNHKSGTIKGVARIYNRFEYGPEKRHALDALARAISEIVDGKPNSNVIELVSVRV